MGGIAFLNKWSVGRKNVLILGLVGGNLYGARGVPDWDGGLCGRLEGFGLGRVLLWGVRGFEKVSSQQTGVGPVKKKCSGESWSKL